MWIFHGNQLLYKFRTEQSFERVLNVPLMWLAVNHAGGTNATTFANATVVTLENITVTGDTTAYAAMLVAQSENGFVIVVSVSWTAPSQFLPDLRLRA